uniref:Peptidase A2 domain-containing protein n=1 Tax=Strongyloides papillosus TaxID=174720 RepID=A0A0N5B1Y2_STREA
MKDIFNKQFEELKAALQPIKGEAMETDTESKLLKKIEEQSEIIISLRQALQIKQDVATQETQKDADPELCSAYNNFVTFITHVKNLKITDALRTVPNSIASLITFLFTLLDTKLVNQSKFTPSFNRNRSTTTNRHSTELQIIQPTSTWRFGDGLLLASVNSILHEALPKIVLFINHTLILTLVDTGASINVISSRIFRQLPSTTVLEISCNDATATSANGTKLLLSQLAVIKLPIDNATYTITCYVSPKIDHDLILGRPGLEAIGDLKISWAKDAIQIGEHNLQLRNTYLLALDEEVILEPRSHNILTPSIRHAPPSIEKEHVFLIFDPYIKGTSALITYQQVNLVFYNKINLLIDNCGNNPVKLPRNTILGHVALVEKINC